MKLSKVNKAKIQDSFHKMNMKLTIGERNAINAWRLKIWIIADKLMDISHYPSMDGHPLKYLAEEMREMTNLVPILFKEDY